MKCNREGLLPSLAAIGLSAVITTSVGAQSLPSGLQVEFRIGETRVIDDARRFAGRYLEYVAHAERAYLKLDAPEQSTEPSRDPEEYKRTPQLQYIDAMMKKRWAFVRGIEGRPGCPSEDRNCKLSRHWAEGLGIHIWRSIPKGITCREFVIAYRGTNFREFGDWLSNAHWFTGWVSDYEDQYAQVSRSIHTIVNHITRTPCYHKRHTTITAVGHSLGGGLAQHAAYAHGGIKRVYAIDSSPVVGTRDFTPEVIRHNTRGLVIEHIYESGEVLAFPRYFQASAIGQQVCHPKVRVVRFNTVRSFNPLAQHESHRLAAGLYDLSIDPMAPSDGRYPDPPDATASEMAHCDPPVRVAGARRGSQVARGGSSGRVIVAAASPAVRGAHAEAGANGRTMVLAQHSPGPDFPVAPMMTAQGDRAAVVRTNHW